ncbi:MAG: alpha/beta fold hydrolase [Candidatus Omnitrophica bacterium]|nr:alpha/beta fold hydrolase [Candidatus Omnitrophota bacterium]
MTKNIIFIHGFGGFGGMWKWQAEAFLAQARVLAVDLPGHGGKAWNGEGLEDMADGVVHAMTAAGMDRAVLVASSFGGLVALKMWEKYSARVERIVFIGSVPRFTVALDFPAGLDTQKIRKLAGQFDGDLAGVLDMFFRSLLTRAERESAPYAQVKSLRALAPLPDKAALLAFLDMLETEDLRDILARVNVPVQFIFGDGDPICPANMVPAIKALVPSASIKIMQGFGHLPFLCGHDAVNRLIRDFVRV